MTTLKDRPNTALLVIDVQNGVVAKAHERDGVIANINTLVDKARREDVPVIWVQHSADDLPIDSEAWQYVPELTATESEPLVAKRYGDSFEDTNLEDSSRSKRRANRGHRRADRRLHPLDDARRLHPRLRRDLGRRRAHDRGPSRVRRADAGQGHRAHEPLLGVSRSTRTKWRHRSHRRRRFQVDGKVRVDE